MEICRMLCDNKIISLNCNFMEQDIFYLPIAHRYFYNIILKIIVCYVDTLMPLLVNGLIKWLGRYTCRKTMYSNI